MLSFFYLICNLHLVRQYNHLIFCRYDYSNSSRSGFDYSNSLHNVASLDKILLQRVQYCWPTVDRIICSFFTLGATSKIIMVKSERCMITNKLEGNIVICCRLLKKLTKDCLGNVLAIPSTFWRLSHCTLLKDLLIL